MVLTAVQTTRKDNASVACCLRGHKNGNYQYACILWALFSCSD